LTVPCCLTGTLFNYSSQNPCAYSLRHTFCARLSDSVGKLSIPSHCLRSCQLDWRNIWACRPLFYIQQWFTIHEESPLWRIHHSLHRRNP